MDNDKKWSVYLHTVPKEINKYGHDKYYVGITSRPVKIRWGNHGNGYPHKDNIYFRNAIDKYGWDNIKHEVLMENLTLEEAGMQERLLISRYKSNIREFGYNIAPGGYNGGGNSKNIVQYDIDGNLIKIYSNGSEAARAVTNNKISYSSHIYDCARKLNGIAYGYMWRYYEDNLPLKIEPYNNNCYKKVLQYDLHGNLINEWKNISEAERYYNSKGGIQNACLGKSKKSNGYQWKYKDDDRQITDITINNKKTKKNNGQSVYVYTVDGQYIGHFCSIKSATEELNLKCKNISQKNFSDITKNYALGYRWTNIYYPKLPPLDTFTKRGRSVAQIDIKTNAVINIYFNATDAAKCIKKKNGGSAILKCCNKKDRYYTAYGYKWEYITNIDESKIKDSFLLQKYRQMLNMEVIS